MLNEIAVLHLRTGKLSQAVRESQEAVSINRERWKSNAVVAGDDFAESLMTASMAQKKSTTKCQMMGEAVAVAQKQELKDRITEKMVVCPPQ